MLSWKLRHALASKKVPAGKPHFLPQGTSGEEQAALLQKFAQSPSSQWVRSCLCSAVAQQGELPGLQAGARSKEAAWDCADE